MMRESLVRNDCYTTISNLFAHAVATCTSMSIFGSIRVSVFIDIEDLGSCSESVDFWDLYKWTMLIDLSHTSHSQLLDFD